MDPQHKTTHNVQKMPPHNSKNPFHDYWCEMSFYVTVYFNT